MYKDTIRKYYVEGNNNCAEALMMVAKEDFGVEFSQDALHALGAFGGGMGCGQTCGALAGAVGAIGCKYIQTVGHESPLARELAGEMTQAFLEKFGTLSCKELKAVYFKEGVRCSELCEKTAEILETIIADK